MHRRRDAATVQTRCGDPSTGGARLQIQGIRGQRKGEEMSIPLVKESHLTLQGFQDEVEHKLSQMDTMLELFSEATFPGRDFANVGAEGRVASALGLLFRELEEAIEKFRKAAWVEIKGGVGR